MVDVLMITGVYYPEVSGAANQCRQLANVLREKVSFVVLTTTRNPHLPPLSQVDGIDVFRVLLKKRSVGDYCRAIFKFTTFFLFQKKNFQIVHLHGFSYKSAFLTALSKIYHKKVIIKMTSVGHDDPIAMRQRGFLLNYFFSKAGSYVGVTPLFERLYSQSQLPANRLKLIPNGVDTTKFRPVTDGEHVVLRDQLNLPREMKLILFVGHFSREKCPDVLLDAWNYYIANKYVNTGIVFVGSTNPDSYEVDAYVVKEVKRLARTYQGKRIFFVERTHETEKYYQAADIFVMPSLREGLPNAMLEAMSCELPVVVSRLEGVTDWVVENDVNGLLISPGNGGELSEALIRLLGDAELSNALGKKARKTIKKRFRIEKMAGKYEKLYKNPSIN